MSKTILKLGSRKSDLARIQAYTVGEALESQDSHIKVQYVFSESFGDQNLDIDLKASDSKGLFTQDFIAALQEKKLDLVVHSWKDLPIEDREGLKVVGTLPREDSRDLLLLKKSSLEKFRSKKEALTILSSSPRREYNLSRELPELLPFTASEIKFVPIRGNIPTRFKKFMSSQEDGLVVAKAALDRMLSATWPEFSETQEELRQVLGECEWMVLPQSLNPCAPAQGALAIEARTDNKLLPKLLQNLHCANTFAEANNERLVLKFYGGGCHQKIGVSHQVKPYGVVKTLSGLTEAGDILHEREVIRTERPAPVSVSCIWPPHKKTNLFHREKNQEVLDLTGQNIWVSKTEAWPVNSKGEANIVWTSGVRTWKSLSNQGIWVHGTADSLGEGEEKINTLLNQSEVNWLKLAHEGGVKTQKQLFASYKLKEAEFDPADIEGVTHFYWMSISSFKRLAPYIKDLSKVHHACGAGHTYNFLREHLSAEIKLEVFLNFENWYNHYTGGNNE